MLQRSTISSIQSVADSSLAPGGINLQSQEVETSGENQLRGKAYLIQERNQLVRDFPIYQQAILAFCQAQDLYPVSDRASEVVEQTFIIQPYGHLPKKIVDFFCKVHNSYLDSNVRELYLSSDQQKLIAVDNSFDAYFILSDSNVVFLEIQQAIQSQEEFSQLCSHIKQNTEFTGFLIPQVREQYQNELIKLLALTAARNMLIEAWPEGKTDHACLENPALFAIQLLEYLASNKSLPVDFIEKALHYYNYVFLTPLKPDGHDFFYLALKTGILPLINIYRNHQGPYAIARMIDENDCSEEGEALYYVAAIQSGSKEVILFFSELYRECLLILENSTCFLTFETLQELSAIKGLDLTLFEELVKEKELGRIRKSVGNTSITRGERKQTSVMLRLDVEP